MQTELLLDDLPAARAPGPRLPLLKPVLPLKVSAAQTPLHGMARLVPLDWLLGRHLVAVIALPASTAVCTLTRLRSLLFATRDAPEEPILPTVLLQTPHVELASTWLACSFDHALPWAHTL